MLAWHEYSREPWRELGTCEHIVLNQARASNRLVPVDSNEGSRNFVMATSAFYSRNPIIDCLRRTEMTPFVMKPRATLVMNSRRSARYSIVIAC